MMEFLVTPGAALAAYADADADASRARVMRPVTTIGPFRATLVIGVASGIPRAAGEAKKSRYRTFPVTAHARPPCQGSHCGQPGRRCLTPGDTVDGRSAGRGHRTHSQSARAPI